MRIMTWNVLIGGWPRRDAIASAICDVHADIVGLQEIEERTLNDLGARLDMYPLFGPSSSKRGSHVGLLSRWPITPGPVHTHAPLHNAMLEAVVTRADLPPTRVFVTHLAAEYYKWRAGEGQRLGELRYILARMSQARSGGGEPQLLMGDFNSLAPDEPLLASRILLRSAELDAKRAQGVQLEGLPGVVNILPPPLVPLGRALIRLVALAPIAAALDGIANAYVPRAVVAEARAAGLVDLAAEQPDPHQRGQTCPADKPAGRIDYIFASPTLAKTLIACEALTTPTIQAASDHRPVIASLAPLAAEPSGRL
jgi:endonuclease/exonuclease/phosphatase family metal-dependent hydrolase